MLLRCPYCSHTSDNPEHVRRRYCASCRLYLDDVKEKAAEAAEGLRAEGLWGPARVSPSLLRPTAPKQAQADKASAKQRERHRFRDGLGDRAG